MISSTVLFFKFGIVTGGAAVVGAADVVGALVVDVLVVALGVAVEDEGVAREDVGGLLGPTVVLVVDV